MEYEIYTESLVYYTLRDNDGNYLGNDGQGGSIKTAKLFRTIEDAKEEIIWYPQYKEIRKVKVIDIGPVEY